MNQTVAPASSSSAVHKHKNSRFGSWFGAVILFGIVVIGVFLFQHSNKDSSASAIAARLPKVGVSVPLKRDVDIRLQFLGQFSSVENVELRAQVGGILTQIGFKDGDIVKKGDLLFVIDPTPYEIALSHATAQLKTAEARLELADRQLARAEKLKGTGAGSGEIAEQRTAEAKAGKAAIDDAQAAVRDAKFDLDHCRIAAPFSGRIGSHLVSIGNLISGSRAGNGPTTLLATLVSVDPIYLNFDMSEADYVAYLRGQVGVDKSISHKVSIALSDETGFRREGTLDFIDNSLDRSSGTIRARATVSNDDLLLTSGAFARVRFSISKPSPVLLVPDEAVLPDQSQHIVLSLDADDVVKPKVVTVGDLRGGLRVIRSGLTDQDRIVIDGIPTIRPGSKVSPSAGTIHYESNQD